MTTLTILMSIENYMNGFRTTLYGDEKSGKFHVLIQQIYPETGKQSMVQWHSDLTHEQAMNLME